MRNSRPRTALRALAHVCVLASAALVAQHAVAQALPNGPLKLVIPFPAGSGSDLAFRPVMDSLGALLGRTVLTDPRPGGNSSVASLYVKNQPPDGSTFYVISATAIVRSLARAD